MKFILALIISMIIIVGSGQSDSLHWAQNNAFQGVHPDQPAARHAAARGRNKNRNRQTNNTNQTTNTNTQKKATGNTTSRPSATANLSADQIAVETAKSELEALSDELMTADRESPQWVAANNAVNAAQSAYDAARAAVLARLPNDAAYRAAKNNQQQAEQALATYKSAHLGHNGGASEDGAADSSSDSSSTDGSDSNKSTILQITALATAAMDAGQAVTRLNADALNSDPAVVADGKTLAEAVAARKTLEDGYRTAMKSNPRWIAAKKKLDDAQAKLSPSAKPAR